MAAISLVGRSVCTKVIRQITQEVSHGVVGLSRKWTRTPLEEIPCLLLHLVTSLKRLTNDHASCHHVHNYWRAAFDVLFDKVGQRLSIMHESLDWKAVHDEGFSPCPRQLRKNHNQIDVRKFVSFTSHDRASDKQVDAPLNRVIKHFPRDL